jgi:DNA gyrase subunit A
LALLKDPNIPLKALMKFLPGPDFPTGGAVVNPVDLERIYETGRGNISLRGRMTTEDVRRVRKALVITEIPYGVKKTTLVERLADLVKEKKLDGITDIRDESSREGIRVVLELRSAVAVERIATQIYKDSPLEVTFGANMLSLLNGRPETLGLKQALGAFLSFRSEVVKRRTEYQLAEAKARSHVILGYCVATGDMDRIVKLIRASGSPVEARQALMDNKWSIDHLPVDIALLDPGVPVSRGKIQFSEIQARAILDLRLHRLTGLERQELTDELIRLKDLIQSLRDIVEKPQGIPGVIISELKEIRKRFAQPRKTQLGTPEIC